MIVSMNMVAQSKQIVIELRSPLVFANIGAKILALDARRMF